MKKIQRLLVANRGEIAIRVFRAAAELNIRTIAIYTFEDRYSLHRYRADEAYQIGRDSDPLKPYLDIEAIITVAKREGADAIHPGYGFLSENVQFATRCREEGIIFVGPDPEVMAQLGDKVAAKEVAIRAEVPIIQDSQVELTDVEIARSEAIRIGFPVMLKAAAGGGGRGMRVIRSEEELERSFPEAKREAGNAFGDDTVFLEKFIDKPKHIEVQLLGDQHGNIVHLFERDCSVQRRFQKVVEIAPAPRLKQETKDALYEYALRLGKAVNYNNAGTVEFLVDQDENIYFIEVNPRIQVEHTVTEEVTGIDIVRSQLLIAQGTPLDSPHIAIPTQESVTCTGFAIQCRITTEDPEADFKPDYGTIIAYRNAGGYGIRIDEGSSYPGVKISPFFDSMLAKVTAKGRTLKGTSQRLNRALTEYRIRGVKTNIPFLENVITHPVFQRGEVTVNFIGEHPELFSWNKKQDRATFALKYLADVIVNGNPDVQKIDHSKVFLKPTLPLVDVTGKPLAGSKDKLTELGPKGFANWLKNEKAIQFTDCTMRDAHQSLLATRVRTKDLLPYAEALSQDHPQIFSVEAWGGATFDVALRFLHECPWDRLKELRKAMPNLLIQMLIRGSNAIGYTAYPNNLVQRFVRESWENGVDVFRIFDSLNNLDNMRVSIDAVLNETQGLAEPCICYTGDFQNDKSTKYSLQYYVDMAKRIEDTGAHILGIKDMAGLLKPYAAVELIETLKQSIDMPIHLHTHDTSGIQSATYLKAIEAGVDVVDVAMASMSGLTSQPNMNSLVAALKGTERELPWDLDKLNELSNYWETIREYYYPFEADLKASTAEVYGHEIPGGQYSNLRPQAQSLGLVERMPEIKKAYAEANELVGDIVKVTPSSKVVGDLAMFMVSNNLTKEDVLARGNELAFPASVIGMMKGELGQPEGGWPVEFQQMVLKTEKPFVSLPNEQLSPIDFEQGFVAFQAKFGTQYTLLDFLSWQFYPKVFENYHEHLTQFGKVSAVPSPAFFFGMKENEEVLVEIARGKTIMVRYIYTTDRDENGKRLVYFKLNGQTRFIEVTDKSVKVERVSNQKAETDAQVGTPLQGMLAKIMVKEGQEVAKNTPLFTIEAMKMESTITALKGGVVKRVVLKEGTLVESGDLVIELV